MHELSVCLALIDQVRRIAADHGATRVDRIVLQIGPLSGVEPALLRNAFPLASAGTPADGAELVIEGSPVEVECTGGGATSEALPNRLLCGSCGDFRTRVTSGEEMTLVSLELTTGDDVTGPQRDGSGDKRPDPGGPPP